MSSISDVVVNEKLLKANMVWPHTDDGQRDILKGEVVGWLTQMSTSSDPYRTVMPINPVKLCQQFPNLKEAVISWWSERRAA